MTTAFVTGAEHPTALGAARELRQEGARVVGFTDTPGRPACRSRAWSEVRRLKGSTPADVVDEMLAHAEHSGGPVFLLPTEDGIVLELARRRGDLPGSVRLCLPPTSTVEMLLEKTRFHAWASARGYPVPRSAVLESPEELRSALEEFRFPAVLKPLMRTPGWLERSPVDKVLRFEAPSDVDAVSFDLFEAAPAYVLSEWIEGEDRDVLFCLVYLNAASDVVASFTGRKLLQFPRLTGSTAVCAGADAPDLEALAARLFKEAGCTGLASLEVKRSASDGHLWITEPTVGRPNLQSPAAWAAGRGLVAIAMRHALGGSPSRPERSERPCVWVQEHSLLRLLASGNGARLPIRTVLGEIARTRRVAGTYLRLSDPGPALGLAREWLHGARRAPSGP